MDQALTPAWLGEPARAKSANIEPLGLDLRITAPDTEHVFNNFRRGHRRELYELGPDAAPPFGFGAAFGPSSAAIEHPSTLSGSAFSQ